MNDIKCPSCGSPNVEQIDTNRYQCPYCGKSFTTNESAAQQGPQVNHVQNINQDLNDNPGCFMNGLCFLIPLLGLVLYFIKKDKYPNCAKSYLTWAAIGFVISIIINFSGFWEGFWEGFYSAL